MEDRTRQARGPVQPRQSYFVSNSLFCLPSVTDILLYEMIITRCDFRNYLNSKKSDASTTTPHPDPRIEEYSKVYRKPGHWFYQVSQGRTEIYQDQPSQFSVIE